jgi:hypothetical protein
MQCLSQAASTPWLVHDYTTNVHHHWYPASASPLRAGKGGCIQGIQSCLYTAAGSDAVHGYSAMHKAPCMVTALSCQGLADSTARCTCHSLEPIKPLSLQQVLQACHTMGPSVGWRTFGDKVQAFWRHVVPSCRCCCCPRLDAGLAWCAYCCKLLLLLHYCQCQWEDHLQQWTAPRGEEGATSSNSSHGGGVGLCSVIMLL